MTPILHIDFETRSAVDLKEVGLWNYARHPTTDVWCMAWAINDEEPQIVAPATDSCVLGLKPPDWIAHVAKGLPVYAHNSPFELEVWNVVLRSCYPWWPALKPEQTFCTMAMAYAMGLPGSLDAAAQAMGIEARKDTEGHALMMRMCRPRSKRGVTPVVWWDDEDKLQRLYEYCKQDVRVERELHRRLFPLSPQERRVWLMDYRINQRGVAVDVEAAQAATKMAEIVKDKCNAELVTVTGGAVKTVSEVAAFKEWLALQGAPMASLAKQDVIDALAMDSLPEAAEHALALRQEAGKASTAKFDVMARQADENGRLHNLYQYHGAGTGRWAGRAIQAHNLPRDTPQSEAVESIIRFVREGNHDAIDAIYGAPLSVLSRCLRAFFMAPKGRLLVSGDFSNVESRGAAWFAGEEWKLEAFRKQDCKEGPDVYKLGASKLLGIPVEHITSEQRQAYGKVPDLAFTYQGGVGSGHSMGRIYGVKATDQEWEDRKHAWRQAHPKIKQAWFDIERAAVRAVQSPGTVHSCGAAGREAKFKAVGSFLWLLLPSGRAICYPYPKLVEGGYGPQLTYMTVPGQDRSKAIYDPANTNKWVRVAAYGGSLFNNIVQGFCRDIQAETMLRLDDEGAEIVLHTHDDINNEADTADAEHRRVRMQEIMRSPPAWAAGFPLHADCKVMRRYGK